MRVWCKYQCRSRQTESAPQCANLSYCHRVTVVQRGSPSPMVVARGRGHGGCWPGPDGSGGVYSLKGGPEPLENEINQILGSKFEDRFSDHFSDLVQNICSVQFSYLLRLSIFCKAPRDMRKFPQKCQKIAGC